ncbi:MAG: hypothetical protein HC924_19235 [Synechococcaceae cyanobacterium SM2_3_2]|nr:hypothetical protein [Synechococcaceae cyanobacterium SM2_3_2]
MTESESLRAAMQEAADESTPAERLRELAGMDSEVARLVAENPNAPVDLLFKLASRYPKEFLKNKVLDLLFLEDPVWIYKMPKDGRKLLAQCEGTSEMMLEVLAKDPDKGVRKEVACNADAPTSLRKRLIGSEGLVVNDYIHNAYDLIKIIYAEDEDDEDLVDWLRDSDNWYDCASIYLNEKIVNGEAIGVGGDDHDEDNFLNYLVDYYHKYVKNDDDIAIDKEGISREAGIALG